MILVADIGGTKTLLALADGTLRAQRRHENDTYPTFIALLDDYLEQVRGERFESACLAVAGPVEARTSRLTNRVQWVLSEEALYAQA